MVEKSEETMVGVYLGLRTSDANTEREKAKGKPSRSGYLGGAYADMYVENSSHL